MSGQRAKTNVRETEIAVEQRHVDVVYERLEELRSFATQREKAGYDHHRATVPGALFERDVFVYNAAKRVADIDAQHEGLVFGRLDSDDEVVRHIGRLGLRDAAYKPLLIDWRAPAAAPFYQATATDRKGVIRRRVIRCAGQQVIEVTDDLLDSDATDVPVVGDGALMAALSRTRTGRMRDIVATIQAEQDAAIRAPARGATMITGGPGTGKTVVALHRAAYLLYEDRRRFEGAGILIVGPSDVFMRYIERVLPSLGEDAASLYSLGEMFAGVEATARDTAEVAAIKGSIRMRKVLARAIRQAPANAPQQLSIVYKGEVLRIGPQLLSTLRAQVHDKGMKPNAAKTQAGRALLIALWREAKGRIDDLVPAEFSRELGGRNEFLAFLDAWWPVVAPTEVLPRLSDADHLSAAAVGILSRRETSALAESFGGEYTISDVALLDELDNLLGRPPKRPGDKVPEHQGVAELTTIQDRLFTRGAREFRGPDYDAYAHIIVDEAQDLSPMQWRMLQRRGQQAGWTIVGDSAQSSWEDRAEAVRAQRRAIGRGPRHEFHLGTNYRNSAEIFDYAARVVRAEVPDADIPRAVRHTGVEPQIVTTARRDALQALRSSVERALRDVDGVVGVVTAPGRTWEAAEAMQGLDSSRLAIVGPLESKGLEYDAVVVLDFDGLVEEFGIRVGYVVLTRATQLLVRVDVGA
ncbi:MAG TPA: AAA family ATPase [Candidatus Stackebrandtia faecavium]|nr:AAA family ATPase [Candidatus Stackebrandtia faecavium]